MHRVRVDAEDGDPWIDLKTHVRLRLAFTCLSSASVSAVRPDYLSLFQNTHTRAYIGFEHVKLVVSDNGISSGEEIVQQMQADPDFERCELLGSPS